MYFRGADGTFDLYGDAGDGYGYEKGQHAVIRLRWDDHASTLVIGTREGSFPGMAENRKFRVVLVRDGHGEGIDATGTANEEIDYHGKEIKVIIR